MGREEEVRGVPKSMIISVGAGVGSSLGGRFSLIDVSKKLLVAENWGVCLFDIKFTLSSKILRGELMILYLIFSRNSPNVVLADETKFHATEQILQQN